MRELCSEAKRGHRCTDDLCRGGGETLCGFDEDLWCDLGLDYEDDDGCYCPVCGKSEDECGCTAEDFEREAYRRGYDPKDDYRK